MQLPVTTGSEPGARGSGGWPAGRTPPSDDAFVGHTVQGIITSWSPAAERLYGYTAAEVIGRPLALLASPECCAELPTLLARLRHGESIDRLQTGHRHKDGHTIDVCVTMSPLVDASGHSGGVTAVTQDLARCVQGGACPVAAQGEEGAQQARTLAMLAGERRRLAGALQDAVVQALYGIVLGARTARSLLTRAPGQAAEPIEYVLSLAEAGLAETRALISDMCPDALQTEGLVAALTNQAVPLSARHGIEVHTDLCEEPALPLGVKDALYRIAQEALHNAVRHAQAGRIDVRLASRAGTIVLEVCDDGTGFDPTGSVPVPGQRGLRAMRERATHLGGTLEIESAPGRGTCLRAAITYAAAHAPS